MRSWLAAVAVSTAAAILMAGCASGPGGPGPGPRIVTSSRVHGTKAQAMALARHLLAELSFPPGTKPVHARSLPSLLRDYQGPGAGWAGGQEILVAPGNPRSVLERLDAHVPFSTPARYGPALPAWSGVLLPAPEPGIDAAQVSVGIAAYSGTTTLVTAHAYATWLPARTAAEHLDTFSFRTVTVGEARVIPSSPGDAHVHRSSGHRPARRVRQRPPARARADREILRRRDQPLHAAVHRQGHKLSRHGRLDGRMRDRCDHGERETAARPVGHACPPRSDGPRTARQRRLLGGRRQRLRSRSPGRAG